VDAGGNSRGGVHDGLEPPGEAGQLRLVGALIFPSMARASRCGLLHGTTSRSRSPQLNTSDEDVGRDEEHEVDRVIQGSCRGLVADRSTGPDPPPGDLRLSTLPHAEREPYVDQVSRLRQTLETRGLDALVVAAAVATVAGTADRTDPSMPTGPAAWLDEAAIGGVVLALLLRGRYPFGAPATVWLACAALSFVDGELVTSQGVVFIVGLGAAMLLGNLRNDLQGRIGLVIVVACAAIVVYNEPGHGVGGLVSTPLLFAISWLVGYALRERTEQTEAAEQRAALAERDREMTARIAVAEERARIARELHDVVAHAVSVMVLQVGAVRHRMGTDDEEDRETLKNVERAGRTALAEMRRLLGAMRHDDEQPELQPAPGLDQLENLLDDVRAAGLDVRLHRHGEPVQLPPGLDLSAYRIVQEALTNTLKHARARCAEVEVTYGCEEVEIVVSDDGSGPPSGDQSGDGRGHGLVGISERVRLYGGDLSAGASASGGFLLRARLPVDGGVE
jgi:signal transduction histidine kinase